MTLIEYYKIVEDTLTNFNSFHQHIKSSSFIATQNKFVSKSQTLSTAVKDIDSDKRYSLTVLLNAILDAVHDMCVLKVRNCS